MKALLVWIALTALSCTATSQNLSPKVQQQGKDTLFCFTLSQSRDIARLLDQGRYCASLLVRSDEQIALLGQLQALSDSALSIAKTQTQNQRLIIDNQQTELLSINLKLDQSTKKVRAERWQKRVFLVTTIALGTWLILK